MASFKVSQFTGVSDSTDDSLLMLSYTADNGSTFQTRKIRVADFLDDIAKDGDVTALTTLTGVPAGSTNLGSFTGTTIADSASIKGALQQLETALELKQGALTASNGIDLTGSTISVKLSEGGDGSLVIAGYSSGFTSFLNGSYYALPGFYGTVTGATGTSSRTLSADAAYNVYRENFGSGIIAYNETEGQWEAAYTPNGFTGTDGEFFQVSTNAVVTPTADSVQIDGRNSPDASAWTEATYSTGSTSYLDFDNGGLLVKALDEDDLASNSDQHLPTQQSVKAYVDTTVTNLGTAAASLYVKKDGSTPFTGDQSMGGFKLSNLAVPTDDSDAATKQYVDLAVQGLDLKASTRAATTENINLSGGQTIDGVAVVTGDRVLVKDQTDASQNGIYDVDESGAWTRSEDADGDSGEVTTGMFTFVEEGTIGGQHGFVLSTPDPIVVDTTELTFVQFSGAGQITAGNGISINGNEISVSSDVLADIADLATLSGLPANSTSLGIFAGSTIADGSTIKQALAVLEQAAETNAANIATNDTELANHETRLSGSETSIVAIEVTNQAQNVSLTDLQSVVGAGAGVSDLGSFTGSTISDNGSVRAALQELETSLEAFGAAAGDAAAVTANADEITALRLAQGTNGGDTNLGTFTGGIIANSVSVKAALQALETGQASNDVELADHESRIAAAETTINSGDLMFAGDNVNELVGSTVAETEPSNYLFVVVDQTNGAIKVIDKTFIETEESA